MFKQFLEALGKWTKRNPKVFGAPERVLKRDNMYHTKDKEQKPIVCVHWDKEEHTFRDCKTITKKSDRGAK